MHSTPPMSLKQAVSLHRKGNIRAAHDAYKALLAVSPNDPFLLGQLGDVALKWGRVSETENLLRRALAAGGSPRVRLCNLQAYLGLLMRRKDREEEVRRLIAEGIPDWPEGVEPSRAERSSLLQLVQSLITLDQAEMGLQLLEQAFPDRAEDVEALTMEGRLRLAAGDAQSAVCLLERVVERAPNKPAPLIALSAAQARMGRGAAAEKTTQRIVRRFGYLRTPKRSNQTPAILVLNPPPKFIEDPGTTIRKLHFQFNYPAEFQIRMANKYRFLSLFGTEAPDLSPWEADAPTLVLNNLVDEVEMCRPETMKAVRALINRIGVPVINPPEAMAQVSREKNAAALAGIPGLKVPQIAKFHLEMGDIDGIVADIADTIGYPAILRHPSAHSSSRSLRGNEPKTVYRVSNAQEARDVLQKSGWSDFYAIEFVNLRKKEGWYRKLRAICVGQEIVIFRGGCYKDWIASGWFTKPEGIAFYREHPAAVEHLRRILTNPEDELGSGCLQVLRDIRSRIPLDIFGIDFDVDDIDNVVFFEASAGMVIEHPRAAAPSDLWLPMEPFERVHVAFHRLVAQRMTERASQPDDGIENAEIGDSRSDGYGPSWPSALRPVRSYANLCSGSDSGWGLMSTRNVVIAAVVILFVATRLFISIAGSWN